MGFVDPEHGRAGADERVEGEDRLVRVLGGHAVDHVDLGADGEHRAGRGPLHLGEDPFRRADEVGQFDDLVGALGVDDDPHAGVVAAGGLDVVDLEALVDGAVALPEEELGLLHVALLEAAEVVAGVPHPHVGGGEAHGEGGVAAQVLVGGEEDPVAPLQGPGHHLAGIRRRAAGAAVAADEGLHRGGGVHVGDGDDPVDVDDLGQGVPALLDLVDVGHVGHGTAGVEVGEDDPLVGAGEHVGRLGHEVHAAEDDVGGPVALGRVAGQLEGIPPGVGPADDLVALVVVAEDQQPALQRLLGRGDAGLERGGGRQRVVVRQGRLQSEHGVVSWLRLRLLAGGSDLARPTGMAAPERNMRPQCQGGRHRDCNPAPLGNDGPGRRIPGRW